MKLPKLQYVFEQDWIVKRCEGKSVLHLGCAGDLTLQDKDKSSLHFKVNAVAKNMVGIDISKSNLEKLKSFCYESSRNKYILGDVESIQEYIDESKYDVVLAGSIIEHLSNPGKMIGCAVKQMNRDGILIISTPHTWGMLQYLRVAFLRKESIDPEHTCWYSIPTLIQLCSRYSLTPVEFATGYGWHKKTFQWNIKLFLGVMIFRFMPHLGGSLLAVFKHDDIK